MSKSSFEREVEARLQRSAKARQEERHRRKQWEKDRRTTEDAAIAEAARRAKAQRDYLRSPEYLEQRRQRDYIDSLYAHLDARLNELAKQAVHMLRRAGARPPERYRVGLEIPRYGRPAVEKGWRVGMGLRTWQVYVERKSYDFSEIRESERQRTSGVILCTEGSLHIIDSGAPTDSMSYGGNAKYQRMRRHEIKITKAFPYAITNYVNGALAVRYASPQAMFDTVPIAIDGPAVIDIRDTDAVNALVESWQHALANITVQALVKRRYR